MKDIPLSYPGWGYLPMNARYSDFMEFPRKGTLPFLILKFIYKNKYQSALCTTDFEKIFSKYHHRQVAIALIGLYNLGLMVYDGFKNGPKVWKPTPLGEFKCSIFIN